MAKSSDVAAEPRSIFATQPAREPALDSATKNVQFASRPDHPIEKRNSKSAMINNKYIPELDGVRAIAVLLVIVFHSAPTFLPGGFVGVDIFFVLSGFLITKNLLSEFAARDEINFIDFYFNRALRLAPAFYLMITVYVLVASFRDDFHDHLIAAGLASFYLISWSRAFLYGHEGYLGHIWSLAIEYQFYLLWPLALGVLLPRFDRKQCLYWILGAIVIVMSWRFFLAFMASPIFIKYMDIFSVVRLYNGFDTRADTILVGCALAFTADRFVKINAFVFCLITALILIFAFFVRFDQAWLYFGGMTLIALVSAVFIASILRTDRDRFSRRILRAKPVAYVGKVSYGMYLWHFPLLGFFTSKLSMAPCILSTLAMSLALASVSFWTVESWFLKHRAGWKSRRVFAPAPAPQLD
jgi:peptidoglycan/LPS O-acetylase OafA/YrhL